MDEKHEELSHRGVIKIVEELTGERIPYTTGEKVLKDSREIVKVVPPRKIRLDAAHRETRLIFANWAIGKLQIAIFVFSDETSVESCQHRKYKKVSMLKGDNSFDHSRPPVKTFDSVMFWGCICEGYRPGPFHVWEKETEIERALNNAKLNQENAVLDAQEAGMRLRARQPGTYEHRVLQERNANVQQLDRDDPLPSGRPRMPRRPEWEFKLEKEERDKGRGGIDWFRYRELILKPKLYPWADQIARETGRVVYIVEDNASPHVKAKRFAGKARERYNGRIRIVDWPPLSPDLNRIERCWDPLKDQFERLRAVSHERQLSRLAIVSEVTQSWHQLPQRTINNECRRFKKKLQQCIDNQGDNNFYG